MHKTSFPKQLIFSSTGKNRLRHRRGNGRAPADPFCFLFLQRSPTSRDSGPAQQFKHAPAQFRSKKHHQFGAVCGNDSSFTNKADLSAIDGINLEHKQESHQSSKDARPDRRRGQPTSRRHARNCAGLHGRGGGAPHHQPTLAERIGVTHQANTTPPGDTTDPKRPKPCYPRRATPRPLSRSG